MHIDKNLVSFLRVNKSNFIISLFFGILTAVFTISIAYVLSRIINNVFLLNQNLEEVKSLLIAFIILFISKAFTQFLQNYFISILVLNIKKSLREDLLTNIISLGPIKIKSERTGEIVNTLINGVEKLENYFSKYLPQIYLALFIPILILIFVFPKDLLSAIIFIVTAPIIPFFMYLIGSIAEKLNQKQWITLSRMSAYFFDVLQGLQTLKVFNKTKDTIKRIEEITNIFRIKTLKVLRIAFLSSLVLEISSTISVAVIAVAIGLRLLNGDFNFADALFILIIAPDFYLPLRQLGVSYHAGMEGVAAFERISILLKNKNYVEEINSNQIVDFTESITFDDVSYVYDERDKSAVENISFKIEKGKVTGIIGQTGAGKSTIMNLLLRFIEPTKGRILIDNNELKLIDLKNYRSNIAWLPQNPFLFNNTVLENLRISNQEATFEEIQKTAKQARIHDLINLKSEKYNTQIQEMSMNLSGGEAQRIALARVILRDAKIICVDEPTSNLDIETEKEIMNELFELYKGKTFLIIAHKIDTIKKADKLILMKDGKIVAEGKHDDLLQKSEYYKKLLNEIECNKC